MARGEIIKQAVRIALASMLIAVCIEEPFCIRDSKILEVKQTVRKVLLDELHKP